jgi:hypothetical protein
MYSSPAHADRHDRTPAVQPDGAFRRPYLDVVVLGLGAFLAFGRIGDAATPAA